jgi:site-specific DNA-methyltransferase (adenine-specific)
MSTPPQNEVIIGDCADVLKQFPDEYFDAVITDPPYGINFMGKEWDRALPSLDALKECCRVLKAGAFGFFMCAPRQDVLSRMIVRLEDSGFNVGFSSIYFCYASGFPKSAAMDKLVDKRYGAKREVIEERVRKVNWNNVSYNVGSNGEDRRDITKPATDEARHFEGSYAGCSLKPSLEVIITVMKPLECKTYLDQALKNGKGISWLSDCRIPCETPHHDEAGRPSGNGFTKQGG